MKSWWRNPKELHPDQKAFIGLPPKGRYSLVGPPGSGKTNLLLLRAQFVAGGGDRNVLIVTYTSSLASFIRTGIKKDIITPDQVVTFHGWANRFVGDILGKRVVEKGDDFDDDTRAELLSKLATAVDRVKSRRYYDAIFLDEAQDLARQEVELLCSLSENICVSGDARQGVYRRDGLDAIKTLGLTPYVLKHHFRIGHKIAAAADRLSPPADGEASLESLANYDVKNFGPSRATMQAFSSRTEQFEAMAEVLRIQLDAFKGDSIGVLCGRKDTLDEVCQLLDASDLSNLYCVPRGVDDGFSADKPILLLAQLRC